MPVSLPARASGLNAQNVPQLECARRDAVVTHLAETYGEVPIAAGLASTGVVIEVFARPDGASWTIVATSSRGTGCLVAHGEAWQQLRSLPEPTLCREL